MARRRDTPPPKRSSLNRTLSESSHVIRAARPDETDLLVRLIQTAFEEYRRKVILWVMRARRKETRERRLETLIAASARKIRC